MIVFFKRIRFIFDGQINEIVFCFLARVLLVRVVLHSRLACIVRANPVRTVRGT